MNYANLKILIFSLLPYFLSIIFIFSINQLSLYSDSNKIINLEKENQKIRIMNYVSLLDIYDANYIDLGVSFPDFILTNLKKDNKIYLIRMDIYGNIVSSRSIIADKINSYFDYQKKYFLYVINTNQNIYLVKLDYMYNPLYSYKMVIENSLKSIYPIFVRSGEIGFWIDNRNLLWIWYDEKRMKNNFVFSTKEFSVNQDIISIQNVNFNPLIFNIGQSDNIHSLILETKTFKQYLFRDCATTSSHSNDNTTYLILNKDRKYYLVIISEKMKIDSFLINSTQNYQDYNVKTFQDYLVLSFEDQESLYITLFDKNLNTKKIYKISKLTENYQIFSNILGLFILSKYNSFPLMIKTDDQVNNSNFLNFSINSQKEIDLSLIKNQEITLIPYEILSKSSKMNINVEKIEKINFDIQDEEIFTRFYGNL